MKTKNNEKETYSYNINIKDFKEYKEEKVKIKLKDVERGVNNTRIAITITKDLYKFIKNKKICPRKLFLSAAKQIGYDGE